MLEACEQRIVMSGSPNTVLRGEAARDLLETIIRQHEEGIRSVLATYDAAAAVDAWGETLRGIEEFINVLHFGVEDGPDLAWLRTCPIGDNILTDPARMPRILEIVGRRNDSGVVARFRRTLVQVAAADTQFTHLGLRLTGLDRGIRTVWEAQAYLQSRRRHFVSLLYHMPDTCCGEARLEPMLALQVLAPMVEHCCATITGTHQRLVLLEIFPDFELIEDPRGYRGNREFEELEQHFLEPERLSVLAMAQQRPDQIRPYRQEPIPTGAIFSVEELRNEVRCLLAAYESFGRDDGYAAVARVVIALSRLCLDDYFIVLPEIRLRAILANQTEFDIDQLMDWLVAHPGTYAEQTNAHQPFVSVEGVLSSNVRLLSRFFYDFRNRHLAMNRRFMIHSGFIFEDMVKTDLAEMGFEVTDAKRVEGREFDVVALKGDVIYNFQCKNNGLNLFQVESAPRRLARANRRLVSYYRRALKMERARQGLLQAHFGKSEIRHYVISRFPVMTDEPNNIPYNAIARLSDV